MASDLWRHPEFLKLWSAQTISQLGSQVTLIALPLTAILVLDASAFQVATLAAMDTLPFLLFALPAGVWVDRLQRRRLMIVADVVRAAALLSIPVASALDVLAMPQLYAVGFATGVATVFFDLSWLSYLPSLVGRSQIAAGNARLEASRSVSNIAGPGIGGGLVGLVGAPTAILADAVSFGVSGALLGLIRRREERVDARPRTHVWSELREGLRYVFGQPYLRILTAATAVSNFFSTMLFALFMVYAVRDLEFSAGVIGVVFMLVNVGGLLGVVSSGRVVRLFGLGPTIAWAAILGNIALLTIPLAPKEHALPIFVFGAIVGPCLGALFNLNQLSLRQAITPERLMGRMNAVVRFMYWGTMPAGAAIGGALASVIGVRETLFVGAVGGAAALVPLALSPLRQLREMPEPPEEPALHTPVPMTADA